MIHLLLFLSFIVLFSCSSKKKTEKDYYNEIVSGFKYKTYKAASEKMIRPMIDAYNTDKPDTIAPLDPEYVRLMLGFMWTISHKPEMAFAEADLAGESTREDVKYLSMALRSINMYEQTWDTLANEESMAAKKYANVQPGSQAEYEISFFYMVMGLARIFDKDFNQSKIYWAGFANETQIHWPYQLTDALDNFQNKRLQQGLVKLKMLAQDPGLPKAMSVAITEEIERIEAKTGDVNSSLFWPKLIATVVFDQLRLTGNERLIHVIAVLEKIRDKLPV